MAVKLQYNFESQNRTSISYIALLQKVLQLRNLNSFIKITYRRMVPCKNFSLNLLLKLLILSILNLFCLRQDISCLHAIDLLLRTMPNGKTLFHFECSYIALETICREPFLQKRCMLLFHQSYTQSLM